MNPYVLEFQEIDKHMLSDVGGKGANLGALSNVEGVNLPAGFCVTTEAYKRTICHSKDLNALLDELSQFKIDDRRNIGLICEKIRELIEHSVIEDEIRNAVFRYVEKFGEENAYAIRSSATAEDLPLASFAGQQDTYLNIQGKNMILKHISKCWASLFTERAVIYRIQNGFDHRKVYLSVVIQRMVFPQSSGIMFTADPVTSNRKVLSIDASFGLGEALVSGLVNADNYKVQNHKIIDKKISEKKLAIYAIKNGGTEELEIDSKRQRVQALTDDQILSLEQIGRKIEAHFGCPQDIEWCISNDAVYIVQSRPITTLYPIPEGDGKNRIYMSVGHHQMMTEAIRPLGMSFLHFLSFWWGENLQVAGGRFFKDLTYDMASPLRKMIVNSIGKNDILMGNALQNILQRKSFIKSLPHGKGTLSQNSEGMSGVLKAVNIYRKNDMAIVEDLIARNELLIENMAQRISNVTGDALFEFILQDTEELKNAFVDPTNVGVFTVWFYASDWINRKMEKWLDEKNAVGTLSQSVEKNITSEMGLELLDVADIVRKYPAVIMYLPHASAETFFEDLEKLEGGKEVSDSIKAYLKKYGMRCPGEIDITQSRWHENPTALIPAILGNIKSVGPNSRSIKFEQGRLEALSKEQDLLQRLKQLPRGKSKAKKTRRMIRVLRNFSGYREYPKYAVMKRFQIYKTALMSEAVRLVHKGVIHNKEDVYYLSFDEFRDAVRENHLDYGLITSRKADYAIFEKMTPPRIMTSDGEVVVGEYSKTNMPQNALAGIPVSSGVIEGRARVILKMSDAQIEEGDILVTSFTDPSWTPLFVSIKGLVTEIGGMNTHGAVITREYGLPAVVGVENATQLIKDGQRIRVNGSEGYVEIL